MPDVRYLIIGYARSGTTALHLAVMGHPDVSAFDGELRPFPFFDLGLAAFSAGGHLAPEERDSGHRVLFDAICGIRRPGAQAFGAKTVSNGHGNLIVESLRAHFPEMRVIHVIRGDTVAHFASGLIARRTGVYHSWQGQKTADRQPMTLPRWPLLSFERGVRRQNEAIARLAESHPYLHIQYEEFSQSPAETYARLFEFLGLEAIEVDWQTSKKVLADPRETVRNYDQCQEWLTRKDEPTVRNLARLYAGLRSDKLRHPIRRFMR